MINDTPDGGLQALLLELVTHATEADPDDLFAYVAKRIREEFGSEPAAHYALIAVLATYGAVMTQQLGNALGKSAQDLLQNFALKVYNDE